MKKLLLCGISLAVASAVFADSPRSFSGRLDGYQEDPEVVSTTGRGSFHARISNDGTMVAWELRYAELEGDILQAHIHFGRHSQSGGIIVFLCTNLGNGPAGTQACPADPATISGVLVAADVVGPAGQGIAAMEFAEFLRALRSGTTYVNVHTSLEPGGEIRSNLDGHGHDHDEDD